MLYTDREKIFIKPLDNKVSEVKITKKGKEYDIKPIGTLKELSPKELKGLISLNLEKAYELQNGKVKEDRDINITKVNKELF